MRLGSEGDLDLDLSGQVIHSQPYTRIEFEHPLTLERIVLILDAGTSKAVVLYADTLNGLQFDYAGKYYAEWPGGFTSFLSPDLAAHPAGWKKTVSSPAKNGSRSVMLANDEITVVCSVDKASHPLEMDVTTPGHSASFVFSNYMELETVDPGLFAIPDDYAIEQITGLEDEDALPL